MALPWSTLVKAIPWSDVIAKAPDLAQGARKLWQKAAGQRQGGVEAPPGGSDGDTRLAGLEARLTELGARQQEITELLAALATQNAELVTTADTLRRQLRRLWITVGVAAALGLSGLILALLGR
ncbi:MAG: hypothetical protein J0L85_18510 [Zoogloea sp.]|nr:hypothetical protein [Zoogloea sp.]MCA0185366.1 hypothetical protein [Pseudomonadota bacterium]